MPTGPAVLRFNRGLPPSKQFGERLRLLVIQGKDKGTCFSILGDLVFIGREGCQIVLDDTNISRKHAELGWKGDHFVVRDLGSANGIVYNGEKAAQARLKPGDIVMVGLTVMEVYAAGSTKKNDRPLLPGKHRPLLPGPKGAEVARPGAPEAASAEEVKKKRSTDKKRLLLYVGLFFLAFTLYFAEGDQVTLKENARIPKSEEVVAKAPKDKRVPAREIEKYRNAIEKTESKIEADRKKIQKYKAEILKKEKSMNEALAEYLPNYSADTPQRRDAEIFFRNGVRELRNKNYRRAFTAFETAITVDDSHDLAKIYLKSAKNEMLAELDSMKTAALQAEKSLRYREARMHYDNIVRYLEGETGSSQFMENEASGSLKRMFEEAKTALADLDVKEKKLR
jgi:hypothetical protein